jgi:hypothetical protein
VGVQVSPAWACRCHLRGRAGITCVGVQVSPAWTCRYHLRGRAGITCAGVQVPPAWACRYHLRGRARAARTGKKAAFFLPFVRLCAPLWFFIFIRKRSACSLHVPPARACACHLRGRAGAARVGVQVSPAWACRCRLRGRAGITCVGVQVPPAWACACRLRGCARTTRTGKKAASVLPFVRPRTYGSMRLCGFYLHS